MRPPTLVAHESGDRPVGLDPADLARVASPALRDQHGAVVEPGDAGFVEVEDRFLWEGWLLSCRAPLRGRVRARARLGTPTMRPFYAILIAVYSVLFVWLRNIEETSPGDALRPLVAVALCAATLQFVATKLLGSRERGAALSAISSLVVLNYGHAYSLAAGYSWGRHRYLLTVALALVLGVIWLAVRGAFDEGFSGRADAVSAILVLFLLVRPVTEFVTSGEREPALDEWAPSSGQTAAESRPRPNVYYLLLDGYGRSDVLARLYDYDNTRFLDTLESLGFGVGIRSFANYPTTLTSLASALNMAYLQGGGGLLGEVDTVRSLYQAIRTNRLMRLFTAAGYRVAMISSEKYAMNGFMPEVEIETCGPDRSFSSAWTRMTILRATPLLVARAVHDPTRSRIRCQFAALESEIARPGPKFVFFHVLLPHPPFLFRANGEPQSLPDTHAKDWNPRTAYIEQLRFLNNRISAILETLVEKEGDSSLVLLHADHGPASLVTQDWRLEPGFVAERAPILLAARDQAGLALDLPERSNLDSPLGGVRWLVEGALGLPQSALPDRAYFIDGGDFPLDFVDVTDLASERRESVAR